MGKEVGIPTPVNEALVSLVKKHEAAKTIPNYSAAELVRLTNPPSLPLVLILAIAIVVALVSSIPVALVHHRLWTN